MKYVIRDKQYHFFSAFDTETGAYVRTGILNSNRNNIAPDPFQASFPHLIDVGIMGHCSHGKTGLCEKAGISCYQKGPYVEKPNMTLDNFRWVAEQCRGHTYQFALGGRGDPDQHENFEEILQICRKNLIVPNFTTSGYGINADLVTLCKKYCGAVAVSWYRASYTMRAVRLLIDAGVKTNIHYVLSKNSIDEAIKRLQYEDFPKGINAVIFLLYKPVGLGKPESVISVKEEKLKVFYKLLAQSHSFRIGIDSCSVPGYLNLCRTVVAPSFDTCEGARYSCYIDADLIMTPCSFDQKAQYAVQLKPKAIEEAWNSDTFEAFRQKMRIACPDCNKRELCLGGCPLLPEIVLCQRQVRSMNK